MKSAHKPLFVKLSLGFLVILLLLSTVFLLASYRAFSVVEQQTQLRTNWRLAHRLAEKISPFLEPHVNFPRLLQTVHGAQELMPSVSFYLLDEKGEVLNLLPRTAEIARTVVALEPIRHSMDARYESDVSKLGTDPQSRDDDAAFSVAPVTIAGKPGYLYLVFSTGSEKATRTFARENAAARGLAFQAVVMLIAAGLAGTALFFLLTKRLYGLLETVEAYQQGNLDEPVTVGGTDEVGILGGALQELAQRVRSSLEALRRKDFERRQLIANVSHDLRTPIGVVVGTAETILLHQKHLVDTGLQRSLENILKNCYSLNQLIKELFELSKFEAREIRPQPVVFTAEELFEEIHRKFESLLEEREIALVRKVAEETSPLIADRQMIERVLFNLIGNALRYTSKGGVITLSADQSVRIRVSDTGTGIPAEKLNRIFQRFEQADDRSPEEGNIGLGLAIVQKIIELHESTITVTSAPGQGTTFEFVLPSADKGEKAPHE